MKRTVIKLGPDLRLSPKTVEQIAFNSNVTVEISDKAKKAVVKSRKIIEKMIEEKNVVYGVTTGFGNFKNKYIDHGQIIELQKNLIKSHAAGVAPRLSHPA